ncbi:MAG: ABC transporter ATP-binding protein [Alteromonadaceae bacterium]|nr:ABC transporter ATP-binding protein [Alteromonadaceae bacterium]MBH85374.1 ABC transporter ATP-binding protein [Alteromonadaceae bacterium]|tara:strand:- start:28406 stop:29116 length:711 start_codon:yes stop_codon:yes gene_type:complete
MSLLSLSDIKVSYGHIEAIKGVSLHVEEGEAVTILGANGAGKTTLMRTISGLLKPTAGTIQYDGKDITQTRADSIVELGIAHSPEGRRVFGTLTVEENLMLGAYTRPKAEGLETRKEVYELFPRLLERRNQLSGTLSGGEQQMLAIGRAMMAKPRLLMLDEPSLGLAPIIVKNIFSALADIRSSGVTILVVEQNARMALKLADRGYVLEVGKIVHEDTAQALMASSEVQEAYLGKS